MVPEHMMTSEFLATRTEVMDWKMFGAWLDIEGNISSVITRMRKGDRVGRMRDYEIAISRDEKEVMEFQRFLINSGISKSYLYLNRKTGVWALKVYRIKEIERIIQEVEPFLLTQKKRAQIEKFRQFRHDNYKRFAKVTS